VIDRSVRRTWKSGPGPGWGPLFSCPYSAARPMRRAIAVRPFAGRRLPGANRLSPSDGRAYTALNADRRNRADDTPDPVDKVDAHLSNCPHAPTRRSSRRAFIEGSTGRYVRSALNEPVQILEPPASPQQAQAPHGPQTHNLPQSLR